MLRTRSKLVAGLIAGLCLIAVVPAQAAVTFPAGKANFDTGPQGWTVGDRACFPGFGGGLACGARGEHSRTIGNPGGSIAARISVTANAGGGVFGLVIWDSPAFTVPAKVNVATLKFDRLIDPGGIINQKPFSLVRVRLEDLTSRRVTILSEEIQKPTMDTNKWVSKKASVDASLLVPTHKYRLRFEGAMSTTFVGVGVVGASFIRYDNAGLETDLPDVGTVTPGVQIVKPPQSNTYINITLKNLKWFADFGTGPGGSLVPTARCTIIGTAGNDVITGTNGNDVICARAGNDRVNGRGGRDIIDGANGNDRIKGGGARDVILGLRGRDRVSGGSGNDKLGGGAGKDRLAGGGGRDNLQGGSGPDRLKGQSGNDRLKGGKGKDKLFGGKGKDLLLARGGGPDRLNGGPGRDKALVSPNDVVKAVEVIL
jgi:hemolysin type calcium-binding protein